MKTYYYHSWTDDFVTNRHQDFKLPDHYQWLRHDRIFQRRALLLTTLARSLGYLYVHGVSHAHFVINPAFYHYHGGAFLYGNHTQSQGDAFTPFYLLGKRPLGFVVSPANLGVPLLGSCLPYVGCLPIPNDWQRLSEFVDAVEKQAQDGRTIIIYPEGHIWPYYTKIRPLPTAAFRYPAATNLPVFAMTTTYQKRRWKKKPMITIFVDGPFLPCQDLDLRAREKHLHDVVQACMKKRAQASNYQYIHYKKVKA